MPPNIIYRHATEQDVPAITAFVDYWLTGGGLPDKTPGAVHDAFVPPGRHLKFVTKYNTILALHESFIVGWAVTTNKHVLIHLLVAGNYRHRGIGSQLLKSLAPETIRSKTDQSSGDPAQFYLDHDFEPAGIPLQGKRKNIQIFSKMDRPEI